MYTIPGEKEWIIIFNKTWNQWGTVYKDTDDALRVTVKPMKSDKFVEMMTFDISKGGKVSLTWADTQVNLKVK